MPATHMTPLWGSPWSVCQSPPGSEVWGAEREEGVAGWVSGSSHKHSEGHSPSCSSILSHSSSTKCFTFLKLRLLFRTSAKMRPGVPTTTWGQFFFNTSSSFLIERPPKNTDTYESVKEITFARLGTEASHATP